MGPGSLRDAPLVEVYPDRCHQLRLMKLSTPPPTYVQKIVGTTAIFKAVECVQGDFRLLHRRRVSTLTVVELLPH